MTANWQEDEFRALSEFCDEKEVSFEVIGICLFSCQVAVSLKKLSKEASTIRDKS